MPLQYSGTPIIYRDMDNSSEYTTIEAIKAALVDAGWTLYATMYGTQTLTGSQPTAAQSVTIGGQQYIFRASLNNAVANEVLIGADADDTLENLKLAIMEDVGSKGTKYSTPTVANASVTASHVLLSGSLTVAAKVGGAAIVALSETSNFSWASTELDGGGYKLINPLTPQRLRCLVKLYKKTAQTNAYVRFYSKDETISQQELHVRTVALRTIKIVANSYQFFTFLYQSPNVLATAVMGGVPYIFPHLAALRVTGVTIDGNDALVSTVDPHGLQNGATVFIADSEGIIQVNGLHTIQVEDADTVRIVGIVPTGVWTSGTGTLAKTGKIARMIWSEMDNNNSGSLLVSFRTRTSPDGGNHSMSVTLNQNNWGGYNIDGVGRFVLSIPTYGQQWFNNQFINMEPYVQCGPASKDTTPVLVGQLWDAIQVNYSYPADITVTFDSHTWLNYTGFSGSSWTQNGALFLAIS